MTSVMNSQSDAIALVSLNRIPNQAENSNQCNHEERGGHVDIQFFNKKSLEVFGFDPVKAKMAVEQELGGPLASTTNFSFGEF